MLLDLHTHTTASDGTYTPQELYQKAKEKGLEVLSITDHDTIDGLLTLKSQLPSLNYEISFTESRSPNSDPQTTDLRSRISNDDSQFSTPESRISDLEFLPGVEISAEFPKTLHILGYGFNLNDSKLSKTLKELQEYRLNRNKLIIEKMNAFGFNITMDELLEISGGKVIGRPHFARLLLNKGYVNSIQEAFDKYLKKGAKFYLDKKRLSPREAIELITNAGGIAVMAHPYQAGLDDNDLEHLVVELKRYGVRGIEAFYSKHTPEMVHKYLKFAEKYELLVTAGSDFHGKNKPDISLGMQVPLAYLKNFLCEVSNRMISLK